MFDHEIDKTINTGNIKADAYFLGTQDSIKHHKMIKNVPDKCQIPKKSAVFKICKHHIADTSPEKEVGIVRLSANQVSYRNPIKWLRFFVSRKN